MYQRYKIFILLFHIIPLESNSPKKFPELQVLKNISYHIIVTRKAIDRVRD